jgi:hypothetical protein
MRFRSFLFLSALTHVSPPPHTHTHTHTPSLLSICLEIYSILGFYAGWKGPWVLSRYSDSLRSGRSGDRIPVEGEIFRTRPGRPRGPPSPLYYGLRALKRPERGVDHPPSCAEIEGREELYICSHSAGPSWPALG